VVQNPSPDEAAQWPRGLTIRVRSTVAGLRSPSPTRAGHPLEHLPRIFNPFFTTSSLAKGGLAVRIPQHRGEHGVGWAKPAGGRGDVHHRPASASRARSRGHRLPRVCIRASSAPLDKAVFREYLSTDLKSHPGGPMSSAKTPLAQAWTPRRRAEVLSKQIHANPELGYQEVKACAGFGVPGKQASGRAGVGGVDTASAHHRDGRRTRWHLSSTTRSGIPCLWPQCDRTSGRGRAPPSPPSGISSPKGGVHVIARRRKRAGAEDQLIRRGFTDVDAAMMIHGFDRSSCTRTSSASRATFEFTGKASHAWPIRGGCQRLDAACRPTMPWPCCARGTPDMPHPRIITAAARRNIIPESRRPSSTSGRRHRAWISIARGRLCRGRRQGCGVRSTVTPHGDLGAMKSSACCSISSRPTCRHVSRKARPSPTARAPRTWATSVRSCRPSSHDRDRSEGMHPHNATSRRPPSSPRAARHVAAAKDHGHDDL